MYFWKIDKLKKEFLDGGVSELNVFIYFMIFMVFSLIFAEIDYLWPSTDTNVWDTASSISSLVLAVSGTVAMFYLNGGKAGNSFLAKYFSISFVASLRYLVFTLPVLIVASGYVSYNITAESDISTTPTEAAFLFVWELGIYWYICKHISDVKNS
jgi:hypothetical protein